MVHDMPSPWSGFPLDFQQTVCYFLQSSALKTFKSTGISGMSGELFRNARLRTLFIMNSVMEYGRFNNPATNKPSIRNHRIVSLSIYQSDIPDSLSLPNLQHLSLQGLPHATLTAWWPIITSSWKNLVRLEISDNVNGRGMYYELRYHNPPCETDPSRRTHTGTPSYSIPKSFNITLLPKLEVFNYWHVQKLASVPLRPTLLPPVTFFRVTDSPSTLKQVYLYVYFERNADTKEELISWVVTDPSWETLDRILTSVCFPNLAKVKITLQRFLTELVGVQRRGAGAREAAHRLRLEVESNLRSSFSRLIQKGSVFLELEPLVP